ncbi:hypothetical protein Ahy_B06g082178 [Arachis hypogaea]|uniref:Uncharacterized protein n=1 Tax=Arachis hypogaea TaxID=3818 RepID=A0A444YN23_ARAHY|nr:hypothetical protein Ahy_B06g082178 [Arachis hypogaea]
MSGRAEATSGGRAKSTRGGRVSNTWGHSAHVSCNDSLVLQYVTYVLGARVADPEDRVFRIGIEYSSRKSIITAIRSYTISRGIDYNIYESEPQTFYAKCKTYGRRCH